MIHEFTVVDMFCGAGGASQGIKQALEEIGIKARMYAINHWPIAVSTHSKNIPEAEHVCEPVEKIDPLRLIPDGKIDLLWASPECTHFSIARGKKPASDQKRASPWRIVEWLEKMDVKHVILENVREFSKWGPLDAAGHPIKSKEGTIFRAFLHAIRSLGYTVDWQILNCANYGDPTSRCRFFLQAVKGRAKISWPHPTHMESEYNVFDLPKWRAAREIIDWSIIGESIFSRKKPLVPATLKRIEHGIKRFWGPYAEPFLISMYGTGMSRSLDLPLQTVTCSGKHTALIEPFLINNYGKSKSMDIGDPVPTVTGSEHAALVEPLILGQQSCAAARPISKPIPTIATAGAISFIEPFLTCYHGGNDSAERIYRLGKPIPTLDTSNRYGLVKPFIVKYYGTGTTASIDEPLDTVVSKEHFALVMGGENYFFDIRYRMLAPHELAAAQGFPPDYLFQGNKGEIVKQIGNAVPVGTATRLTLAAIMQDLRDAA
jgi:DNA (cytosine-5)-methyltransferase 1